MFDEANKYYQNAIEITPVVLCPLFDKLRETNIDFIVAPYDADAQLAYLASNKAVDMAIIKDSNLIAYQRSLTLFDLDCNGNCKSLSLSDVMKLHLFNQMDQNMMIENCVLAGCDYLPPIPRMGIITSIKRLLIQKTVLVVISELRAENDCEIPDNYEQDFQNACSIFTQHRVFDHHSKSVVGIYEECILDIAGPYISNEDAINIAIGRMNPKTKQFYDTENNYKLQKSVDISNINDEIEGGFKKCNDSNVPDSFFTFANLKDLKYNDSTKFISFLKVKAISEGFQIVL